MSADDNRYQIHMDPNNSPAVSEEMSKINNHPGRKRSRSLSGYALKGLCETIPISLPPSQRLLMFIEQWFRHAVSTKQNELMGKDDDIETFQQKTTECWQKIKAAIEEKNLANLAVAGNTLQDSSQTVHSNDVEYNKTIAVFEAESEKWDEQTSKYRESLQKKTDSPVVINASEWKNSDQLYDYSNVIKSASSIQETLCQQVGLLPSVNTTLSAWTDYSKILRQCAVKKTEKSLSPNVEESPRTALRNMTRTRQKIKNSGQSNQSRSLRSTQTSSNDGLESRKLRKRK